MTDFLGSGAFGEVYEGVVRAVGEKEQRVAIKVCFFFQIFKLQIYHSPLFRLFVKVQVSKKRWNFYKKPN